MSLANDLKTEVEAIYAQKWEEVKTENIPDPADLRLDNHAKHIESATVLYADLDGSTNMVDKWVWWFSSEIYKSYLRCAARIINSENGSITAYDGDRIMAIFAGANKNTRSVRAALKINYAVERILRPALKERYPKADFTLNHVVGIDTSPLRAARIGVRGYNDLVWVGSAANHAAKLTNLSEKPIWITKAVYDVIHESVKVYNGTQMWDRRLWTPMNNKEIYCSTYLHAIG